MPFNEILQAVSTVGFPIVMCGVMFYYMQKNDERHQEEVSGLRDAINNNTIVMNKVLERLEYEE